MAGLLKTLYGFLTLSAVVMAVVPAAEAGVAIGVSVQLAPPALPVYDQPVCPGPGYLWTPGYWAYGPDGYYWVPGIWVLAPHPSLLWTPGYWGWADGAYLWHAGYWGPHVGYYGGISYGFGYTGSGYYGGSWRGGVFCYNRAVSNVNVSIIHNTYSSPIVGRPGATRVSFNGPGGASARPTPAEMAAERDTHIPATARQAQHEQIASANRNLLASVNHGRPSAAALAQHGAPSQARGGTLPAQHGQGGMAHPAMHGQGGMPHAAAPHSAGARHAAPRHVSAPHE